MAVIAGAGESLGGYRTLLSASARLQDLVESEARRVLHLGISVDLDVGSGPELIQVGALFPQQTVPAGRTSGRKRRSNLIMYGGTRALTGPAVGYELDDAEPVSRF